ncbi:hypothetical protein [Aestuariivirga sp.]|jgi:hypothetical protein|uniref:hypothetical protein n=1 Tax=Aestuariivirga sp. TaxID=2650926 RepID=UPI0037848754
MREPCFSVIRAFLAILIAFRHAPPLRAQESRSPIAAIAHGAFVDATGKQILLIEKLITESIAWYRNDVMNRVPANRRAVNEKLPGEARRSRVLSVNQRLFLEIGAAKLLCANSQRLLVDDRNRRALNAY